MRDDHIIDAEFTVITPARKPFRIKWGRIRFGWNWEGALIGAALGLPRLIQTLMHHS